MISKIKSNTNSGVTLLLSLWLCGGLLYVLPNRGGAGLNLPQNLLVWAIITLIVLWCIFTRPLPRRFTLPAGTGLLLAGALLWSLPLLWSPRPGWQLNALPKVAALWGMIGFYFVLLCTTSCSRLRSRWLIIIALAALTQTGYAIWQLADASSLPDGRPYASFQQVNVLASFLATGLACALWIFLQYGKGSQRFISGAALFILPAMLVILQSRAGHIGAILSTLLILAVVFAHKKKRSAVAAFIVVAGTGAGFLWLYAGHYLFPGLTPPLADKDGSTFYRLYMLKLTWQMILQHPFAGNGYGSFEALYGQLAQFTQPGLETATIPYPHNEFLYAWAEGGLLAAAGLLLMVIAVFRRLWAKGGTKLIGVALLLPVAVHMNLEYPLYQSATHGLVLVMLLIVSGSGVEKSASEAEIKHNKWPWRVLFGLPALATLIFMLGGLQTQARLTSIEQRGLMPLAFNEQAEVDALLNPYSQFTRLDFDRHVALLLRFNQTHDAALLNEFRGWAEAYLQVHNDPSVYFSLLMIARAQRLPEAGLICLKAKGMWLADPRFHCG